MSREIGCMVVGLVEPGSVRWAWVGPVVTRDRAIELVAEYGQKWPQLDWVLARAVVEEDE